MVGIAIRFIAGRFHATPWGRHVNEAAPEWPPSPWRLLRSLVSTWKRKADGDPKCAPEIVKALLQKIAVPPHFVLPPAGTGHARHFMPWFKKRPNDRTLVFDAFVALDKSSNVVALWPDVGLDERERVTLAHIAENLGVLGRAESWVEARLLSDDEMSDACKKINCTPLDRVDTQARDMETVRVLCADPASAFSNEHTPKSVTFDGRGKSKKKVEIPLYDPDWHLCMETLELHEKRWSDPPGSRWVTYLRRGDCFAVKSHIPSAPLRTRPIVARFALDAAVLPLVEDTLRIAESARYIAMGCFRRIKSPSSGDILPKSEVFSGKDATGKPLKGHSHTFYLPSDEDGDGRLDHLTIVAAMGFGPDEVKALDRMRHLPRPEGEPVNLLFLGLGVAGVIAAPKLLGPSRVWVSATPFVSTRHAKSRGTKKDPPELLGLDNQRTFARHVLVEELARLRERRGDVPAPTSVEALNPQHRIGAHKLRPIQFKRFRQKRGDDGGRRAAGAFRIVFPEPVTGPISLGHSSHFGLGLFVPDD